MWFFTVFICRNEPRAFIDEASGGGTTAASSAAADTTAAKVVNVEVRTQRAELLRHVFREEL